MPAPVAVKVFFNFRSPYCYLASKTMFEVLGRFDCDVLRCQELGERIAAVVNSLRPVAGGALDERRRRFVRDDHLGDVMLDFGVVSHRAGQPN